MPIKNILALISNKEFRKKHPTFDVDPEILIWARLHAEVWLPRWKQGIQRHWTEDEERNNYIGLIGHKCFELTLQQLEIPYVPNDPVIDWRGKKKYDFRIPHIETLEVKTVDYKEIQKRLLIKCSEWHNSDYVFTIKLNDETPTKAKFVGYAPNEEILTEFIYAEKEWPCRFASCYWQFLERLHPASEFFQMLRQKTKDCWKT